VHVQQALAARRVDFPAQLAVLRPPARHWRPRWGLFERDGSR
jgi:hypothetical protein